MKVAVISANLGQGGYDQPAPWPELIAPDGVEISVIRLTDETFPPRLLAMTSRLLCGEPKMFGWDLFPGFDVYLWIDASCRPTPTAVEWFMSRLGKREMAVFQHPDRRTIRDEYDFVVERMKRPGETYLTSRYKGERFDELFVWLSRQWDEDGYQDAHLYASTAFIYRPTPNVKRMMADWWLTKTRWSLHDQIAWPYLIWKRGIYVNVIPDNYLKCPALEFVRKGIRRSA